MRSFKNLIVLILTLFTLVSVAKAEYFTDIIVTSPSGIWTDERAYSTIDAAIADIGSAEQILLISREVSCTNLTVPSNITLKFIKEGSINNTGQLTINTKNILSEGCQIFVGSGDIDFADGSTVRSSWFPSLSSIATYTDDDNVNLTIEVDEPETVDYNITFDGRQSLKVNRGCPITIANGITLTLSGPFEAGLYQVFDCEGTGAVSFGIGSASKVYPEWWGAVGDGTTDDYAAIQAALTASIDVELGNRRYAISTGITIGRSRTNIYGNNAVLLYTGTDAAVTIDTSITRVNIYDLYIVRYSPDSPPTASTIGLYVKGNNCTFTNVHVSYAGAYTHEAWYYGARIAQWTNKFFGCELRGYYAGLFAYRMNGLYAYATFFVAETYASCYIVQGSGHGLYGCFYEGRGLHGLRVHSEGAEHGGLGTIGVFGGSFEGASNYEIYLDGTIGETEGKALQGVTISGVYFNLFNNASIEDLNMSGIYATYVDGLSIHGCNFRVAVASGGHGIYIGTGCNNVDIGADNFYDSTLVLPLYIHELPTKASIFDPRFNNHYLLGYGEIYTISACADKDERPDVSGGVRILKTTNTDDTVIKSLSNMRVGQIVTIICFDEVGKKTTIMDGGNFVLNGNFSSDTNKSITLIKDGVYYIELSRS